jgi:hypothetical protein
MLVLRSLLLVIATALCSGSLFAYIPRSAEIAPGVQLLGAEFGIYQLDPPRLMAFTATNEVTLLEGQLYGWRLYVRTSHTEIRVRSVLELPSIPLLWGFFDTVESDPRIASNEELLPIIDGVVTNAWEVAVGDPAGEYVLRIFITGQPVRTFKFKCVAPAKPLSHAGN